MAMAHSRIAASIVAPTIVVLALAGCASPADSAPAPTVSDTPASAVSLLRDALASGSPGATDEQLSTSLDLTIKTLQDVCADPDAPVAAEAYDLLQGAQTVLSRNGIVACDAFG